MYFIVLRAQLGQLLSNLPPKLVLPKCIRSFIVDTMPGTETEVCMIYGKI